MSLATSKSELGTYGVRIIDDGVDHGSAYE